MSREKSVLVIHLDPEEVTDLTLEELCSICQVTPDFIQEIIAYGVIEPVKTDDHLHFHRDHLQRVRTVLHLQQDLEVNLAGAALVIDLMTELETLRSRINILEKYFSPD